MKVLVIQPKIGMGDMVIYLPYIHAISRKYQTAVSILVKENSRANQLLAEDKHIKEILILDRTKNNSGTHDGFLGFFKLSRDLKLKEFDKVFIFNSSLRYLLISKIAGIKNISQYPLFRKKDNIVTSAKIFTENEIGEIVSTQPELIVNENKVKEAKLKFSKEFKHICLGISASGPTKRWDIKNFIKLCINVNARTPSKFYLAAGNNDKDLIDEFLNSELSNNCISFKDLKISETLPIIKNCNLSICNDSSFSHLSAALGIKTITLMADTPLIYGNYSSRMFPIIPDGEETVTHNSLGKEKINPQKIFKKIIEILN